MSGQKCAVPVMRGYHERACGKTAKHEHAGEWYCKIYHPPSVAEKKAAWDAKYNARRAERKNKLDDEKELARRSACFPELLAALKRYVAEAEGVGSYATEAQAKSAITNAEKGAS